MKITKPYWVVCLWVYVWWKMQSKKDKTRICRTRLRWRLESHSTFGSVGGHFRWRASLFQNLNLDSLLPLAPAQAPPGRSRAIRSQSCEGTEKTGRNALMALDCTKFSKREKKKKKNSAQTYQGICSFNIRFYIILFHPGKFPILILVHGLMSNWIAHRQA